MKILGLDYGDKRIGVALGDDAYSLATPLTIIDNQTPEQVVLAIQNIIKEENCGLIVVGWPLSLANKETEQTQKTRVFVEFLKKNIEVPVRVLDERFTSQAAASLKEIAGREYDDAEAAASLLQMYLDLGAL